MSDGAARSWAGRHFDGLTPRPREAVVRVEPGAVVVTSDGAPARRWAIESVVVIRSGGGGDPVQLELLGERTESLFVADPRFFAAIREANAGRSPRRQGGGSVGLRVAAILAVAGALLVFVCWRWGVPALAAAATDLVPPAWERELGAMALRDLAPDRDRVTDARIAGPVRDVFARLVTAARPLRDTLTVAVTRTRAVNAFAAPGGHVVVTTGLLATLRGPDELAAVLAHEITHLTKRHTTRGLLQRQGLRVLVGLVAGEQSALGSALGAAEVLGELSYSRADEREADEGAAELLARAGIPPEALARALESMSGGRGDALPELGFLSTHPATRDRLERVRALASRHPATRSGTPLDGHAWNAMKEALPSALESVGGS